MPIKATRHHVTITRVAVIKQTDNNTVGEDVQMLETLYVAGGNVKQCRQCGKQSTSSLRGYIYLSYAPAYSSSSIYLRKRNYNKHPYKNLYMRRKKNLYMNVHSSIIHSNGKKNYSNV